MQAVTSQTTPLKTDAVTGRLAATTATIRLAAVSKLAGRHCFLDPLGLLVGGDLSLEFFKGLMDSLYCHLVEVVHDNRNTSNNREDYGFGWRNDIIDVVIHDVDSSIIIQSGYCLIQVWAYGGGRDHIPCNTPWR